MKYVFLIILFFISFGNIYAQYEAGFITGSLPIEKAVLFDTIGNTSFVAGYVGFTKYKAGKVYYGVNATLGKVNIDVDTASIFLITAKVGKVFGTQRIQGLVGAEIGLGDFAMNTTFVLAPEAGIKFYVSPRLALDFITSYDIFQKRTSFKIGLSIASPYPEKY